MPSTFTIKSPGNPNTQDLRSRKDLPRGRARWTLLFAPASLWKHMMQPNFCWWLFKVNSAEIICLRYLSAVLENRAVVKRNEPVTLCPSTGQRETDSAKPGQCEWAEITIDTCMSWGNLTPPCTKSVLCLVLKVCFCFGFVTALFHRKGSERERVSVRGLRSAPLLTSRGTEPYLEIQKA